GDRRSAARLDRARGNRAGVHAAHDAHHRRISAHHAAGQRPQAADGGGPRRQRDVPEPGRRHRIDTPCAGSEGTRPRAAGVGAARHIPLHGARRAAEGGARSGAVGTVYPADHGWRHALLHRPALAW
ncbi:hypothetical protein CEF00_13475, partial [Lactobacillus crispatus]